MICKQNQSRRGRKLCVTGALQIDIFQTFCRETIVLKPNKYITDPGVIKHISCLTQLSFKFHLLKKNKKTVKYYKVLSCLNNSDVLFILLLNVKIPTSLGI